MRRSVSVMVCLSVWALGCDPGDSEIDEVDETQDAGSEADASQDAGGEAEVAWLDEYLVEGDRLFPEGIAFDAASERFLVGSLSRGDVHAIAKDGTQTLFAKAEEGWRTLGLDVDPEAGVLWACATPAGAPTPGVLWRYTLDGEALPEVELSAAAEGASCNDVVVDGKGGAYVTDPGAPRVFAVDADGAVSVLVEGAAELEPGSSGVGPNGLAITPDGATLVVGMFDPPGLVAVSLSGEPTVSSISLTGEPFESENPLAGPDGLLFDGDELVVVFEDAVFRLASDAWTDEASVSRTDVDWSGLTTAARAEDAVYVLEGHPIEYLLNRPPRRPFLIRRLAPAE